MTLTPRLEQRQSQSLVMTPQLQQAIKLLQLSSTELIEFVEKELESNPMLERDEQEIIAEPQSQQTEPVEEISEEGEALPDMDFQSSGSDGTI